MTTALIVALIFGIPPYFAIGMVVNCYLRELPIDAEENFVLSSLWPATLLVGAAIAYYRGTKKLKKRITGELPRAYISNE